MSTIDHRTLDGFEQRLLTELKGHVSAHAAPAGAVATPRRGLVPRRGLIGAWRPRAGALAAAATAATATVVAVLSAMPGVQPALARAFPILTHRPHRLPAYMQHALSTQPIVSGRWSAHDRAYAFQTPTGTGYVVVDQHTRWLCILIPNLGRPRARANCDTGQRLLSRDSRGLRLVVDGAHRRELVWLLPKGSTATTITAAGATRPLALRNGVLAIVTKHPVRITATVHGHPTTLSFGA